MRHSWLPVAGVLALLVLLPFAVRADDQIQLEAVLEGAKADPGAFGRARVDAQGDRRRFEVRVEGVTQASSVIVTVGPYILAFIELDDQGRGEARFDTQNGDEVPEILAGWGVGIFGAEDFTLLAAGELMTR